MMMMMIAAAASIALKISNLYSDLLDKKKTFDMTIIKLIIFQTSIRNFNRFPYQRIHPK